MKLLVPDEDVDIANPSLEVIEAAVRKSFTEEGNATVLVVDSDNNLFIQNVGDHVEYNEYDSGPIYAVDGIDVEIAVQLYLSYAKGGNEWKTGVDWQVYLTDY